MATTSSIYYHQPRRKWSMNDLSSELVALIFEQLQNLDPGSVTIARCLCRRFDAIATPIAYRTLRLNDNIIAPDAELLWSRALQRIYAHTNHVVARSDLHPLGTKRILDRIQNLLSLRWRYVNVEFRWGRLWVPSDVLNPQTAMRNQTKLYIEELPLRYFEGQAGDTYLRAIPAGMLVSLSMAYPTPPLTTQLASLKRLLLEARNLEAFHYQDRGQGTQFAFSGRERLPAFKELSLKSYDWGHDRAEVQRHWDFSRTRSLELVSVPVFNFLSSVSFPDFCDLHTLHVEDYSAHLPDRRREATQGLYILVGRYIRALRTLKVTCHTQLFGIDAITTHADSLRHLRLRDHVGFGDEDRRSPTLWPDDVTTLARALTRLQTLELDLDVARTDPPAFLLAVCAFPRLHTLTLHMQTVLTAHAVVHPQTDPDRDAAVRTFAFLLRNKTGDIPWRRITVNVGGWRPVMIRRLSDAWLRLNEHGVFAERCFVLERWGDGDGEMAVREEMAQATQMEDNAEDDMDAETEY